MRHGGHIRSRSAQTWIGYCAGLVITPLLVLAFAKSMTAWYGGLDADPAYATAVMATRELTEVLDQYRSRHQRIPRPSEGLAPLVPEFLERVPLDPWGNPFVFQPSGPYWGDVLSYGADGLPGGHGVASDISGRFGRYHSRPPDYLETLGTIALIAIPLGALLAARRWQWAAGLLAGTGTDWAVLLLSTLSPRLQLSLLVAVGFSIALCCMVGSVAILRHARGAHVLTCGAVLAAHWLLEHLITAL